MASPVSSGIPCSKGGSNPSVVWSLITRSWPVRRCRSGRRGFSNNPHRRLHTVTIPSTPGREAGCFGKQLVPHSPLPARKTMLWTITLVARFHSGPSHSDAAIVDLVFWQARPERLLYCLKNDLGRQLSTVETLWGKAAG